jgi:anaerobic magnesium-protoporphyrin IX monomethyl ester cyclase
MKVQLLNPPYPKPDYMRNSRAEGISLAKAQWHPIWLAYATGWLEKHGHTCKLIDAPASDMFFKDVLRETKSFSPDLLAVYPSWETISIDVKTAEALKKATGCKVVFIGPWASINPKVIMGMSSQVDFVAQYEFDDTLLDLANEVSPKDIRGLFWRKSGSVKQNPPRPFITGKQLNEFPFVSDIYRRYLNIWNYKPIQQLYPCVDLFTGRGCYWGLCTFCLWPHTLTRSAYCRPQDKYRVRDMSNVIDEFRFIQDKMPEIKEIFIQDDTLPPMRAKEMCKAIIKEGLDITWSCFCRVDYPRDVLALMKKAGCRTVHIGLESSNQKILNNIQKGVTAEQGTRFAKWIHELGLEVHADFIIGLPGETKETIKATQKWAYSLDFETYQFTIPKIYPGTPFYEWLEKNNYIKNGEVNYPDLSSEDIRYWAKKLTRDYYLSWRNVKKLTPQRFSNLAGQAIKLIPKLLWERW